MEQNRIILLYFFIYFDIKSQNRKGERERGKYNWISLKLLVLFDRSDNI